MTSAAEPTMIGLSERAHAKLKRFKEDGIFSEMVDAYRCAIALALAHGVIPGEVPAPRTTVFSVASVDPERELGIAIKAIMNVSDVPVYRMAERLAEWGVEELSRRAETGDLDMGLILAEVEALRT